MMRTSGLLLCLASLSAGSAAQDLVGGQPYVALETREATEQHVRELLLPNQAQWGEWWLLSAFPFEDFDVGALAAPLAPEAELPLMQAGGPGPDLAATYAGKHETEVAWQPLGRIEGRMTDLLVHGYPELDEWSLCYLYGTVTSSVAKTIEVSMGTDDGLRFWSNGELLIDRDVPRGLDVSSEHVKLKLEPGVNHVLAKVSQGVGGWAFQLNATKALDPVADAELQYYLDRDFPPSRERAHYRVITVPVPEDVVLEVGGLDTFADGRPVVATRRGDVYAVDGAYAEPPARAEFTRFASGLHEPLGAAVQVVGDGHESVLAVQRGELTRLVDEDGDGRADLYQTVSADWGISGNYHEFAFGPKLDAAGNAWVTLCVGFCGSLGKSVAPYRGWAAKVTPAGEFVPVCSGLRSPNGIGANAAGAMFYLDNQGDYVATNKLAELVPGAWHGHPAGLRWREDFAPDRRPPRQPTAVWFPYRKMGQSTADLLLDDTGGAFGPFEDQLFVGDQTLASVMRVQLEEVEGHWQGACFPFLEGLDCGVNRLTFAPDGSMFVGETDRGWGSVGRKPYGLQRVVYTGVTPFELLAVRAREDGFELEFTLDVDPLTAADPESYRMESYTYAYHPEYGAPEDDTQEQAIVSATVLDARRVRLVVDELKQGYVHELWSEGVRSATGEALVHADAYYTLQNIPGRPPLVLPAVVGAQAAEGDSEARADVPLPRVLFLTHSAGFVHDVVKRSRPELLALAEERLVEAAIDRFDIFATQDCSYLEGDELDAFDAVVFYTTGELPVSETAPAALVDWVRRGGAFIGVHSASDTFYEFPPYLEMVGGTFDGHPWNQEVALLTVEPGQLATRHLEPGFRIADEIYEFKDFTPTPLRVLLRLDPSQTDVSRAKHAGTRHPLAWIRPFGRGHVFYTALGHRPEVWSDERFLEHLLGGIHWALGAEESPRPAPAGADVLFDGRGLGAWILRTNEEPTWRADAEALEVVGGTGDLVSRTEYGDAWIHVEFRVPDSPPEVTGQARGNSGVYVQGRYEVQVLDSYDQVPDAATAGAIYEKFAPEVDATRLPGVWQSYDILFRAPRFEKAGFKTDSARMSVWYNGIAIHRDVEIPGPTMAGLTMEETAIGPLLLQDHGSAVQYRNVWVLSLE